MWQLSRQFPFSLEFGERLLLTLFDNAYASAYGTFLCNNEKERRVGGNTGTALSLRSSVTVTTVPLGRACKAKPSRSQLGSDLSPAGTETRLDCPAGACVK